jgi:hypothetical protein
MWTWLAGQEQAFNGNVEQLNGNSSKQKRESRTATPA